MSQKNIGPFEGRDAVWWALRIESLEGRFFLSGAAFSAPVLYSTGDHPVAIAVGDLNGDGSPDIVTANFPAQSISVLLNNRDGTFSAHTDYGDDGLSPSRIAIGDVTGDGIPDIVVMDGGISVFAGVGDGTFLPPAHEPLSSNPVDITLADVNSDGKLDVVFSLYATNTNEVGYLPSNGDGTFGTEVDFPALQFTRQISVEDINGDGIPDIVGESGIASEVSVFPGAGGGQFAQRIDTPTGSTPSDLAVGDLNGDGKLDVVTVGSGGVASILLGDGTGHFGAATPFGTGISDVFRLADVNRDGKLDLIDTQSNIYLGNGEGTFAGGVTFDNGSGGGVTPADVVAADLNGDGAPDLVVSLGAEPGTYGDGNQISVLANTNNPALTPTTTGVSSAENPATIGNSVDYTAVVSGAGGTPTGSVEFFDGQTPLSQETLDGNGTATVSEESLAFGNHAITAEYLGDSTFAGSTSDLLNEAVVAPEGPALSISISSVTIPAIFVSGDKGVVTVSLENVGSTAASGIVRLTFYIGYGNGIDESAFALPEATAARQAVKLKPGAKLTVSRRFVIPTTFPQATYRLFAKVGAVSGLTGNQLPISQAVSTQTAQGQFNFGSFSGRRGVTLIHDAGDGVKISYKIIGPGEGEITDNPDGHAIVDVTNTTAASRVLITPLGGKGILEGFSSESPTGAILASRITDVGDLDLAGNSNVVTFAGVMNGTVRTYGATPVTLTVGAVKDYAIVGTSSFKLLNVGSWLDTDGTVDTIEARSIETLHSRGAFDAEITHYTEIRNVVIGGAVGAVHWLLLGPTDSILLNGGAAAGFSLSDSGDLKKISINGNFAGDITVGSVKAVSINGSVSGSLILAGASAGGDGVLGGGDDVFEVGTIASFSVKGSVSGSVIAAGLDPVDGVFLDGDDVLIGGGSIADISIGRALSSDSRILAATLPRTARVNGRGVKPAGNKNFALH